MESSPPSERFRELAARLSGGEPVGLAEVALAVAGELAPGLDAPAARAALDRLGSEAAHVVPREGPLAARVAQLTAFLGGPAGFCGDETSYGDPRNSFLDAVLARRKGIPITLAIVYVEVGARVGLPLAGVSFPAHFLVRTEADPPLVIDAYHGRVVDETELRARLARALGEDAAFGPERLAPASPADVAVRMLANLKHGFAARHEWLRALDCCERILLVTPGALGELRDRGLLYEQLECFGPALADLERFLALVPGSPEADSLRARVEALRPRAAAIH